MNKLKQNAFWVGIGVAAAVLVGLFVILVIPQYTQKSNLLASIGRSTRAVQNKPVASTKDIEQWNNYRQQLAKDFTEIGDFYTKADQNLERYVRDLPEPIARGVFMTNYSDSFNQLEEELKKKGVVLKDPDTQEGGFNWEVPQADDFNKVGLTDEPKVLKTLQKRYWARERVANVILKGQVKVHKINAFRFPGRLHEKLGTTFAAGGGGSGPIRFPFEDAGVRFQEMEFPQGLGRTMTFGFAVTLPYGEVPKFIREFLNPTMESSPRERILVNVIHSHVTILEQNKPEIILELRRDDPDKDRKLKEAQSEASVKPVLLLVTAQIVDFEPAKLPKFEAPAGGN